MKNPNDHIRIRIRDLPACCVVPQTTAPQRASGPPGTPVKCRSTCINVLIWSARKRDKERRKRDKEKRKELKERKRRKN